MAPAYGKYDNSACDENNQKRVQMLSDIKSMIRDYKHKQNYSEVVEDAHTNALPNGPVLQTVESTLDDYRNTSGAKYK